MDRYALWHLMTPPSQWSRDKLLSLHLWLRGYCMSHMQQTCIWHVISWHIFSYVIKNTRTFTDVWSVRFFQTHVYGVFTRPVSVLRTLSNPGSFFCLKKKSIKVLRVDRQNEKLSLGMKEYIESSHFWAHLKKFYLSWWNHHKKFFYFEKIF